MRRQDRHPFKWGTGAWRNEYARLRAKGMHPKTIRSIIRSENKQAENMPLPGERCLARTRRGTPCQRKALQNGRCPNHGGLSTPWDELPEETRQRIMEGLRKGREKRMARLRAHPRHGQL